MIFRLWLGGHRVAPILIRISLQSKPLKRKQIKDGVIRLKLLLIKIFEHMQLDGDAFKLKRMMR